MANLYYVYRIDQQARTWYIFDVFVKEVALKKGIARGIDYSDRMRDGHMYLLSEDSNADWSFRI